MTKKHKFNTKISTLTVLLIILISSILVMFPMNSIHTTTERDEKVEKKEVDTDIESIEIIESPKSSILGNDTWWDINWLYRQLITITNPYDVGFENYPVMIHFNYTELVDLENGMNASCKDLRIVENGQLRKYYFRQDYPNNENCTVWFDTDIAKLSTEYDTYLYFGNNKAEIDTTYFMNESSSNPADAFGWIRNGDFEVEHPSSSSLFNFFGWTYSNSPPSDIDATDGDFGTGEHGFVSIEQQEKILEGDYTFKWGDSDFWVDSTTVIGPPNKQDYEGRLYTYPFVIPTLVDNPLAKLYITGYINVRSYTEQPNIEHGFTIRISNAINYGNPGSAPGTFTTYINFYSLQTLASTQLHKNPLHGTSDFPADPNTRDPLGTAPYYPEDGELTGEFTDFDVTAFQGDCVFFEACLYGPEGNKRSVFAQVDGIKFNYDLNAILEPDIQRVQGEITVIAKDVDGRIVPNAEISLVDVDKTPKELRTQFTDDTGETLFSNIGYGTYNFTVNYTLSSGIETVVFNSSKPGEPNYIFDESQAAYEIELVLNMSTIDFEIVDSGGRPLNYGFVHLKESKSGRSLENITLDSNGTATFRWLNVSRYYYEVYYSNIDYATSPLLLNKSYIYRSDYVKVKEKFQTKTFWVNKTNILGPGTSYQVNQYIYTNGSTTELGNKKIINFTLILDDMDNFLTNVSIYYVDKSGSTTGNLIFTDTSYTPSDDSATIEINIKDPPVECANLITDNYEAYGLLLIVKGINNTVVCNGRITVNLVETNNIYNRTALARMNIRVIDKGEPIDVARVLISQGGNSIANLSSYVDKGPELINSDGWIFGRINYELPFWYIIGQSYNFTIKMSGQYVTYEVNRTLNTTKYSNKEQWKPSGSVPAGNLYNATMTYDNGTLIFDVGVADIIQQTRFNPNSYTITEQVIWGENIYVKTYYEYSITGGASWSSMPYTGNVFISFKTYGTEGGKVYHTAKMNYLGSGWLNYTLNSSLLSAGILVQGYIVTIFADEFEYVNPSDSINYTAVNALSTGLSNHEYSVDYNLQLGAYEQYFGELINISIKYYDNITKLGIPGATLFYDWLNLGDKQFYVDPMNSSYYTITLNTSLAESVGPQLIKFTAYKENYTIQENILITLRILERPTYVNNQTGFYYLSKGIYIQDIYNFTFAYTDILKDNSRIGDLNIYDYIWQKTDSQGNPAGPEGQGNLVEMGNNKYILDFDTEKKDIGYYIIYVTMHKDNYELRTVVINFIVSIRTFDAELDATNLDDDLISVVHGKKVKFELTLKDETRGGIPLEGAIVEIEIGDDTYDMEEESPGVYTYEFETDDIDAFFSSKTFTVTITIQKEYFAEDEIELTLEVTMEEIYPGMPTFYFIMIVSSISAVAGALIGYRVIQQARIPKFVKKIRAVKKAIKSQSSIPSVSITTKNKMFLKELGKEWRDLGISLRSVLGVEEKKSPITKAKELIKQKGGDK